MKKKLLASSIRGVLSVAAPIVLCSNVAIAQTTPKNQSVEEVMVTGSRIGRDEFSSASPISVFDTNELAQSGVVSVDEFLKDVPAFTGFQLGSSTNNGGDGQKKVDMRGLGFNRTLVLINGRRQIGDVTDDGAVDLNTIPTAMIKRVEVLKDGASTVYGSDALAGVVNIILQDDFEGFQVTGKMGQGTEDGQAPNEEVSMLAGVGGERGNIVFSMGYSNQDEMLQAERPWAQEALYPLLQDDGTFQAVGSGSSNARRIRTIVQGDGTETSGNWVYDTALGQARPFEASDTYNYAPVNALITPIKLYQFGTMGNLKINDHVTGYMEALFTRRSSQQRLAPDASFRATSSTGIETPNNGGQYNDYVPASNPFNPFGVNGWGPDGIANTADDLNPLGINDASVSINRRFEESGGRLFRQSSSTFRMVSGFKGTISDAVDWDVSYIYAENETIDETKNYGRFDRWAIAVDPDACAADSDCTAAGGVLNPFGDYGSITPGQMAYLSTGSLKDQYFAKMDVLSVSFNGEIGALPGGGIGWAAGFDKRRESGFYSPDEFISEGLTTGGAGDPLNGGFSVDEFFIETRFPVLSNLIFDASARYSDYDTVGDNTTYKLGVDYNPVDSIKLRAGISTGFRAPNISELNQQDTTGFPIVEPLCEFADRRLASGDMSQAAYDNCVDMGVDTTDSGEYGFAWQSAYTTRAPQEALEPEESTSMNFGIVYQPEFVEGLRLSADYWDIEVDKLIDSPDLNDLMAACLNSAGLSSPACSVFPGGEPFDSFGSPADATSDFGNLGRLATSGWDFQADYSAELGGSVIQGYNLGWSATWQQEYIRDFDLSGEVDLIGTANGFEVFPEWKFNIEAGIEGEAWTATWKMRYIDETEDALRPASITDDAVAESMLYHDLVGTYTWQNVSVILGINNLTDEEPPRFHSAFNANTEPGMYDVIGRRIFTSVKLDF